MDLTHALTAHAPSNEFGAATNTTYAAKFAMALLEAVLADEELTEDAAFVEKLDVLLAAITNVQLSGEVERSVEAERRERERGSSQLKTALAPKPGTRCSRRMRHAWIALLQVTLRMVSFNSLRVSIR